MSEADQVLEINKISKSRKGLYKRRREVPFLTSSIPDLSLYILVLNRECSSLKLDPNGGFRVETELVTSEPRQDLRFPHGRVSDQHHLEHIVYLLPRHVSISSEVEGSNSGECEKKDLVTSYEAGGALGKERGINL